MGSHMEPRIVLEDVKTSEDTPGFQAEVTLKYKDKTAWSSLEGTATKSIDIIAQATLDAVRQYFEKYEFNVSRVHIMKINTHNIVVVLVNLGEIDEGAAMKSQQAGIALEKENLHHAIAKATLNALNRVLGKLT